MKKTLILTLIILVISAKSLAAPTIQGAGGAACSVPHVSQGRCVTGTINWPASFGDNNYSVSCTLLNPTSPGCNFGSSCIWIGGIQSQTPTGVTVVMMTGTASQSQAGTATSVNCVAIHT